MGILFNTAERDIILVEPMDETRSLPVTDSVVAMPSIDDAADLYFGHSLQMLLDLRPAVRDDNLSSGQRQCIIATCVTSFLSLEAVINRLFFHVFEDPNKSRVPMRQPLSPSLSQYFERSWLRMPIREKFIVLPSVFAGVTFDTQAHPFRLFDEFIRFRNRLVHPKVTMGSIRVRPTDFDDSGHVTGGEVVELITGSTLPEQLFPLTRFATTFQTLTFADGVKALEITYRMRIELMKFWPLHPVCLIRPPGKSRECVMSGSIIGQTLEQNFTIHFGPLEKPVDRPIWF